MLVPPVMRALLGAPDNRVQGFLGPGHVCAVMGCSEYEPIVRDHRVPIVITGFEPLDLLEGHLVDAAAARVGSRRARESLRPRRPARGKPRVAAADRRRLRSLRPQVAGNRPIPQSGYKLRDDYRDHDAERIFDVDGIETHESSICISGQILQGLKKPHDCPAFGRECTPQTPLGATMVSSEGACAAYYAYGRHLETGWAIGVARANPISQPSLPSSLRRRRPLMARLAEAIGTCPLPVSSYDRITLGHGSGGL